MFSSVRKITTKVANYLRYRVCQIYIIYYIQYVTVVTLQLDAVLSTKYYFTVNIQKTYVSVMDISVGQFIHLVYCSPRTRKYQK